MSDLYKYNLYCSTCSDWKEVWAENTPTACPSNENHTIVSGSIVIEEIKIDTGLKMDDGRSIVRADTRPLGTKTYFTMTGDDLQTGELGAGDQMRWDFSNDDDTYDPNNFENPRVLASGIKAKYMEMEFTNPVYLKDGALFFFDAPWGAYVSMYIVVPSGTYYPHPEGTISASDLGLSGNTMYAYSTKKVFYASYLNKHFVYKDCSRGVDLDAEGAQVEPVPSGWLIAGLVCCPEDNNTFKGFGLIEMYRKTIGLL